MKTLNILLTYLLPIFIINYYKIKKIEKGQFNLMFKVFNICFNIGIGQYNYIIFSIFLNYNNKFDTFKGINYNKRFGIWQVKGINARPYLLNIFNTITIKNIF